MELKQLMLDIREALAKKDVVGASEIVNSVLSTIEHGEAMEQERLGYQHWEKPILDYDGLMKMLDKPGCETITVQVSITEQVRLDQYMFLVEIGSSQETSNPKAWQVASKVLPVAEEFEDWATSNIKPSDESNPFSSSWVLVALFGTQPDPRLFKLIQSERVIIAGLHNYEIPSLFNPQGWANFISNRFTMFQDSDLIDFDTDTE